MAKLPNAQELKKQMQNLGFYLPVIRDGFKWSLEELGNRLDILEKDEQNVVLNYRMLLDEDKSKLLDIIQKMRKEPQNKE